MTAPTVSQQELRTYFDAVDVDGNGFISVSELQDALGKAGFVFSLSTVSQFLKISGGGTQQGLPFANFHKLHNFLTNAQAMFQAKSGGGTTISKDHLRAVLSTEYQYGWLEPPAFDAVCKAFDPDGDNSFGMPEFAAILAFMQSAVGTFKGFDPYGRGQVTMSLSQFVYAAANTR